MTINYTAYDDDKLEKIKEESFKILEPDIYDFKVIKATEGVSKSSGNSMVTLDLCIWDKQGGQYFVKDFLVVTDRMIYKFKHFWISVGKPEMYGKPVEEYEFVGLCGSLKTKIEEQTVQKKDGSGEQKMKFIRVDDYVPSDPTKPKRSSISCKPDIDDLDDLGEINF